MSTNRIQCKNCEKDFEDGFEFCPHCGQKTKEDLTFGVLFYNTISNYFSFDARFFKSFIPLLFKPGYLAKRFISGKRLAYLHPAQLYLFISVIFFFIFSFYVRDTRSKLESAFNKDKTSVQVKDTTEVNDKKSVLDSTNIEKLLNPIKENKDALGINEEELKELEFIVKEQNNKPKNIKSSFDFDEKEIDSLLAINSDNETIYKAMGMKEDDSFFKRKFYENSLRFYKERGLGVSQLIQIFVDTIPIAMFFLLPIFALLLKLLFFKRGRYTHHLVFSFYYFSFLFLVFAIIFGVNHFIIDVPDWLDWLITFSTFIYLFIAVRRYYGQGWILSFIKSNIATFLFLIVVLPISFITLILLSFLMF